MSDDRNGFDLAPPWLNSHSSSLQKKTVRQPSLRPSSARFQSSRSNQSSPRTYAPTTSATPEFRNAPQFPPLTRNHGFAVASNSVWEQGAERFRSSTVQKPEDKNEKQADILPSASFNRLLAKKPISSESSPYNRRVKLLTKSPSDKTLLPLNAAQGSQSSSSSFSSGQFQSLGTIKSKKKTTFKSAFADLVVENNNESVEIPFEPTLNQHPSTDERYFCQLLYPDWEDEVKKTQPLSKREVQQWAVKQPKMAKQKLNNMKARGLGDDSFSILFAALEFEAIS